MKVVKPGVWGREVTEIVWEERVRVEGGGLRLGKESLLQVVVIVESHR